MLTYKAIVAVRYPELVLQDANHTHIGHFVPHEATVAQGGFRTVLWNVPKDLRAAVEDVVSFCNYLKNCYPSLRQGATSQLLVLCNRTAVHNLLQHGFQTTWYGALRVSTTSSGAGATARIAVIVQTGCGFLSGGRRGATLDEREDCYGRATVALTRAIEHTYIVSPLDMAGMIGMAQTLGVYHYVYFTLRNRDIQYHGPTAHPSDQSAVLEWGLDSSFTPQDKPPLAIAMIAQAGDVRTWKRYRLVLARKEKLHLTPRVLAILEANTRTLTLTTSGFFPCSIAREYLYGYATDGYRSPLWLSLWLCAAFNGSPALVHARSGHKIFFHSGIQDRQLVVLSGIHYFDARRLTPELANSVDLPIDRRSKIVVTEGGNDPVSESSSEEEEGSTDVESDPGDPTVAWCPPIPDATEDPTEVEIASAADQLAILISKTRQRDNPFCNPDNLGALPPLWLQARLQLTLPAIQEKFSRILVSAAGELWLRGQEAAVEDVLLRLARALTVRLAEKLAQALSAMMRLAESMVTPETECLLYATYWFRPILSELLGTAQESAELNKNRAPSGPVKVLVTDRPHKRLTGIVDICSGASSLLAWFPASWASKIAPHFLANPTQKPQILNIACPKRAGGDAAMEGEKQTLQAVRFAAKSMPFLDLAIDKDLRKANCFAELIHGYTEGLVEPNMMRALQPVGPGRTTLEVIIPSQSGLSPEKWKETATLCPLDWPSNYSLLRLWHINSSLQKTESRLRLQTGHSHMYASWTVTIKCLQNESCFGGQRSLKPRLPCKQTSGTLPSQIDDCDSELLQLPLRLTKQPSRHCISMLVITNKHTQSTFTSPMSGSQQSHLTSNTIANIV